MKTKLAIIPLLALLLVGWGPCQTVPTTSSASTRIQQIAAQTPGDVALILTPILQHNPKYAPDVALIGKTLPALIQNGPIDVGTVTAALTKIPGLTDQEVKDLQYVEIGLPAVLQLVQAITGQTIVLYTDPNIKLIVDAFCAGMVSAAGAIYP